ncbi:CDP-glycerol glycerophosphotransferase family protein [Jonesia quinghaiensis]|uniref:CDP-glycerol glycerophosphotransferase family protein n=1 Tax=Jonesia quinghaiensis TaxID=262806 RepID=UPI00068858F7|nr:CDP-glycerol glycerophosphotransferase family protein [Jonesia quinghaiensis]
MSDSVQPNTTTNPLKKLHTLTKELAGYPAVLLLATALVFVATLAGKLTTPTIAVLLALITTTDLTTRRYLPRTRTQFTTYDGRGYLGSGHAQRYLTLATASYLAITNTPTGHSTLTTSIVIGFAVLSLTLEPITLRATRRGTLSHAHLPWAPTPRTNTPPHYPAYLANTLTPIPLALANHTPALLAITAALVTLSLALQLLSNVAALSRNRIKRTVEATLRKELTAYQPKFYLYYDAAPGTAYQIGMWLPHLDAIGERYCVILRNQNTLNEVAALTNAPVIVRNSMTKLDDVTIDSVTTVFYANNAIKNAHFVRFHQYTHIQLNHGDSDKPPSYNPAMRMYDRNFVAGQAAVERYANHGVDTAPGYFDIVGRPQIKDIQPAHKQADPTGHTMLYAPTWAGFMADSQCSSLHIGLNIINAALSAGTRIIFRPHPHARKTPALRAGCDAITARLTEHAATTGIDHVFGETAEREWSIIDCINHSDSLISDVSSVIPDYLYSGKPIILTAIGAPSLEEFLTENPIGAACYILTEDLSNLHEVIAEAVHTDTLREQRQRLRTHYLGDFPHETYDQAFLTTARRYVNGNA